MNLEIKGVHYDIEEETKDYIEKKIHKFDFVADLLMDLSITIKREKKRFTLESNINFRWGNSSHLRVKSFDIKEGIDTLIDKLDNKIHKEKGKIQEHGKKT